MSRHVEHCLSKVEGPSPPTSPSPLPLLADCPQIYGLLGSPCGLRSFFLPVLCPLPLFSFSHFSPGRSSGKIVGNRPRSLTSRLVYFKGALELGVPLAYHSWGLGMAWDLHDPALLFTEGRLLHG